MKTVKGSEVLEYLMAGCLASPLGKQDFEALEGFIKVGYILTSRTRFEVDESTRKKENLTLEEALCAMRHGHCVARYFTTNFNSIFKLKDTYLEFWDRGQWFATSSVFNIHDIFSIVPDPSAKQEEPGPPNKEVLEQIEYIERELDNLKQRFLGGKDEQKA